MPKAVDPHKDFGAHLGWIPDAAVVSNGSGTIILTNDRAVELFGHPRERLVGRLELELLAKRFRDRFESERGGYFSEGRQELGAGEQVTYMVRADGSEFPAEISRSIVDLPEGRILITSFRNISDRLGYERDRLEAQEELSQTRRVESLGKLAGGIAHDFNNLLGVILNYAEFVASDVEDRPAVHEDVVQIQAAAERAADLTRQLLLFSRREVRGRHPVQINEALVHLEKLLDRVLGERVEVITDFDSELANVVADVGEVEQLVLNLALNARDAMPKGGTLKIETKNVVLDEAYAAAHADSPVPGSYVRITVSDTGSGMDAETVARAFEPFFTTKPTPEGTGLGLATVYGIVKSHGGNILLYSEVGHGTSVKIHLPASDLPTHEPEAAKVQRSPTGDGSRLLVVEDDPMVRKMVVRALTDNGFEVVYCERARQAFDLLGNPDEVFDLLLTDVVMPDVDGAELAKRAAQLRPSLPVLFMSGYSELNLQQLDHPSGELSLLEKPFTVADLLHAVAGSIERHRA